MADENKTIGYRPQINYTENYDTDRGTYERQSFNDSLDKIKQDVQKQMP